MSVSDIILWSGMFLAGMILAYVYFGTLWWAVRRLPQIRHPAVLIGGGYVLRLSAMLVVFYIIAGHGGWISLLVCLAGFILMRVILVRKWGGIRNMKSKVMEGASFREYQSG